ncbi:MAG TPA: GNAT family acetyltransferase [Rhizobiales bacterium]|nr:acetyltransferase YpeA [bacterium BMS3Bbin10]HDO52501.1 GNAT family acetyltransferase [Hyphomicrobiales bacterium]
MPALDIREIGNDDVEDVAALWERCGLTRPWNDPHGDIAFARKSENAAVLVGRRDDRLAASALVGHDGHRGAVYYVCVDPEFQDKGLGRAIMAAAEEWLRARGVWKLNLMVRADNAPVIDFYSALGYDREDRVTLAKWIDPSRKPRR